MGTPAEPVALFNLFMRRVFLTRVTIFFEFKPVRVVLFVFDRRVISFSACRAGQGDNFTHFYITPL